MSETLYRREVTPSGRVRYIACSEYDRAWDALPVDTTWVIDVKPHGRSLHRVPSELADVLGALEPIRSDLANVLCDAMDPAPPPHLRGRERKASAAAVEAYKAARGNGLVVWQRKSAQGIVDALFRAVAEKVGKR